MASPDEWKARANPDWLGRAIEQDDLPWGQAVTASMPQFLAQYTLHDSTWRGLFLRAGGDAVATILWDTHWNRDRLPEANATAQERGWPFLFLRFTVYQVTSSIRKKPSRWPNDVILNVKCDMKSQGSSQSNVHQTHLDCLDSQTSITHRADVSIVCLNSDNYMVPLSIS